MTERYWMKEPCGPCPYSRSKTLPLHPERAADFAYMAANRYNEFPCHKTADHVEDEDGHGEFVYGRKSLTCNGFLSLQCTENDLDEIEGFEPHPDAFGDHWEMIEHHQALWDDRMDGIAQRRLASSVDRDDGAPADVPASVRTHAIEPDIEDMT